MELVPNARRAATPKPRLDLSYAKNVVPEGDFRGVTLENPLKQSQFTQPRSDPPDETAGRENKGDL